MVTKFMIATAVPFYTARLQTNLSRNIVVKFARSEKSGTTEEDVKTSTKTRRKRTNLSEKEKFQLRRQKNKTAAQVSRARAKIQQSVLEQRLSELKYEKMKLLLENQALQSHNMELKDENKSLKLRAQNVSVEDENSEKAAFEHAWLVNVPLLKEWVLSRIFLLFMMSAWETFRYNTLILNYSAPYFKPQQIVKSLMLLVYLPWKSMIPLRGYPLNLMILNG